MRGHADAGAPKKLTTEALAALWADGPAPPELVDLMLMRDVFHCTPSELAEQRAEDVQTVLLLLDVEATVRRMRREAER